MEDGVVEIDEENEVSVLQIPMLYLNWLLNSNNTNEYSTEIKEGADQKIE